MGSRHAAGEAEYDVDPFALQRFQDHSRCFHSTLRFCTILRLPKTTGRKRPGEAVVRERTAGDEGQEAMLSPAKTAPVSAPETKAT